MRTKDIVGRKLYKTDRFLVKEAYERGIQFEILPKGRFRLFYDKKRYLVRDGIVCHGYNTILAKKLLKYKSPTNNLLTSPGFSTPENAVFKKGEVERAWKWAEDILPVVVKPNDGVKGRLVYVNLTNYEEFKQCFEKVAEARNHILIEQFVEGDEYRFTYLKNEIIAVAKRVPANVIGDGVNNIEKLIAQKNEEREARKNPIHLKLDTGEESERVLSKQGLTFKDIPRKDEVIYLRSNSNVSTGGDAIDVTDEINPEIKEAVRKALSSITGLRVCGADVIINNDTYYIIEANTNPMLTMHLFPWEGSPRNVMSQVIDAMFPETAGKN